MITLNLSRFKVIFLASMLKCWSYCCNRSSRSLHCYSVLPGGCCFQCVFTESNSIFSAVPHWSKFYLHALRPQ